MNGYKVILETRNGLAFNVLLVTYIFNYLLKDCKNWFGELAGYIAPLLRPYDVLLSSYLTKLCTPNAKHQRTLKTSYRTQVHISKHLNSETIKLTKYKYKCKGAR